MGNGNEVKSKIFIVLSENTCKIRKIDVYHFSMSVLVRIRELSKFKNVKNDRRNGTGVCKKSAMSCHGLLAGMNL